MKVGGKGKNLLKLVHPGGFVEIHKRPITAAEVMTRNPRHCVAHPDVFKCPRVVVRPEAVLKPGNVFYIVPNHTIYRLLQANDNANLKPSEAESQTAKQMDQHHHQQIPKRSLTPSPYVHYYRFTNDSDEDDSGKTPNDKTNMKEIKCKQAVPTNKGDSAVLDFNRYQGKECQVKLKPCLKNPNERRTKPHEHKKVRFSFPVDDDDLEELGLFLQQWQL